MKKVLTLVLISSFITLACNNNEQLFDADFDKVITESETIGTFPHPSAHDSLISYWYTKSNGKEFVAYDYVDKNFKRFDENYNYVTSHGNMGRGPLEFVRFSSFFFADNGKYYLFDSGARKMIVYDKDDDDDSFEFNIQEEIISIAVDKDGNILVYHLVAGKETVLSLYDNEGNLIKDFFSPNDQNFKTFVYRFKNGNVAYNRENDRFYFMYPDSFDLYEINSKGIITDTLKFTDTGHSDFLGKVPAFPGSLDPFDMSDEHWKYWMSFIQPFRFYILEGGSVLYENLHLEDPRTFIRSYSLISMDGNIVFENIVFPEEFGAQVEDSYGNGKVLMKLNNELTLVRFKQ
ncbi:MAG: hypothetical protein WD512_16915 [Candidatus Paceibacterota bacterium]